MIIFSSKYHKSTTTTTEATGKVNGQQIFIAFDAERRARRACNIYCNSHAASGASVAEAEREKEEGKEDKKIIEQQQKQEQQQEQQLAVYCHCHSRKLHSAEELLGTTRPAVAPSVLPVCPSAV